MFIYFRNMTNNSVYINMNRLFVVILSVSLICGHSASYAQSANLVNLPVVGSMVSLSKPFIPTVLSGIKVFPDNPLRFDFIVDTGDSSLNIETHDYASLQKESKKLIKYFLAALTTPEEDMWVNLSPYEKDRIVPKAFGQTEMGRDLLAQDYILKQLSASLMYPEKELGKNFWDKIYQKAYEVYGTTEIPINTFNKVWIVPQKAVIYENAETNTAFVVESRLKAMLEEDYLAVAENNVNAGAGLPRPINGQGDPAPTDNNFQIKIIRKIIIPTIEKEINEGKNFANLRQIYQSLILAAWFKEKIMGQNGHAVPAGRQDRSLLGHVYIDQNKIEGVDIEDKNAKEKIYQQYLESFKKGVYNYIKEDYDPMTQEIIPRKYFSGGTTFEKTIDIIETAESSLIYDINQDKLNIVAVLLNPEVESQEGIEINEQIMQITDIVKNSINQSAANDDIYDDTSALVSSPVNFENKMKAKLFENSNSKRMSDQFFKFWNRYMNGEFDEFILELGGGALSVAEEIAKKNPDIGILSVDLYGLIPGEKVTIFDLKSQNELLAKTTPLDNLSVIRIDSKDILGLLPDETIDHLLLVAPFDKVVYALSETLSQEGVIRKFKENGQVVFKPLGLFEQYKHFIKNKIVFVEKGEKFFDVVIDDFSFLPNQRTSVWHYKTAKSIWIAKINKGQSTSSPISRTQKEKMLGLKLFIEEHAGKYIDNTGFEIAEKLGYSIEYITPILISNRIETKKFENRRKQSEKRLWLVKYLKENRNGKSLYTMTKLSEISGVAPDIVRQAVKSYNVLIAEEETVGQGVELVAPSPIVIKSGIMKRDASYDTTKKRVNQDYGYVDEVRGLILVSDGVGGWPSGDIASKVASETVIDFFKDIELDKIKDIEVVKELMEEAVLKAHQEVVNYQKNDPETEGMTATLSFGFVWKDALGKLFFIGANLGNSRLFYYSKKEQTLKQISQDDAIGSNLTDSIAHSIEKFDGEDVRYEIQPKIELKEHQLIVREIEPESIVFALTDGFQGIDYQTLKSVIDKNSEPDALADILIALAKTTPIRDDMTISVLQISEDENTSSPILKDQVGGIDLNPANLNIETKGTSIEFDLPFDVHELEGLPITGFTPIIFNITPVINLPLFLGLEDKQESSNNVDLSRNTIDPADHKKRFEFVEAF